MDKSSSASGSSKPLAGLRAAIAQSKSTLNQPSSAQWNQTTNSRSNTIDAINKGVHERAKRDIEIKKGSTDKPSQYIMIGGLRYRVGDPDHEDDCLIDMDRKYLEEYERMMQGVESIRERINFNEALLDQHRMDEEEESKKRTERRLLLKQLSMETEAGREDHKKELELEQQAKEERRKLLLSKAKAYRKRVRSQSIDSSKYSLPGEAKAGTIEPPLDSTEPSPMKKPKTEETF